MFISTGIDLTEISRIEKSIQSPRFLSRVFSHEELEAFSTTNARSLAANFCAKEAFSKALGTGVRGFALNEVSVLRNELGAPFLSFTGKAAEIVSSRGLSFSVSLSHSDDYATAIVIAYSKE